MSTLKKFQVDYVAGVDAPRNYQREGNFDHGTKGFSVYREEDAVTFTIATDEVGLVGHGLALDEKISFTSIVGGTTNISVDTDYFVKSIVSADAITIAATIGGATIDLDTSDGTGTMVRAKPKLGTGGSPTLTLVRSTSSPLKGDASGLLTKSAANLMGEGISYDFTIDRRDLAKNLYQRFVYEIASGTFATGDIKGFIYGPLDGTPVVTALNPEDITSSANPEKFESLFTTPTSGLQYRLCLHISSVSVLAYSLKLDDFRFQQIAAASSFVPVIVAATAGNGQSIGSSVVKVQFDGKDIDTASAFDEVTDYDFTTPSSGKYRFSGTINWGGTTSVGSMNVELWKNGAAIKRSGAGSAGLVAGWEPSITFDWIVELVTNDIIEIYAATNPTNNLSAVTPYGTVLNIEKLP